MTFFAVLFAVCAWFAIFFTALAIASMSKPSQPRLKSPSNVRRVPAEKTQ